MSRVSVVGLGLIGGSAALAFAARGWDRSEAARHEAGARGIDVASSLEEAVRGADVVLAAVPGSEAAPLLLRLGALVPRAILTDATSVKRGIVEAAANLPPAVRFVAGHPMAGAASAGISAARADLFAGRPWFLVPTVRSDEKSIDALAALVQGAGAIPRVVDAGRHDAAMTWVSHLPLAVSAALARTVADAVGADVGTWAGPGLTDATRLAGTPGPLARELALADPAALAAALAEAGRELQHLAGMLRKGESVRLEQYLADAARARNEIARQG